MTTIFQNGHSAHLHIDIFMRRALFPIILPTYSSFQHVVSYSWNEAICRKVAEYSQYQKEKKLYSDIVRDDDDATTTVDAGFAIVQLGDYRAKYIFIGEKLIQNMKWRKEGKYCEDAEERRHCHCCVENEIRSGSYLARALHASHLHSLFLSIVLYGALLEAVATWKIGR